MKLKPCPFCGKTPVIKKSFGTNRLSVECENPSCDVSVQSDIRSTEDEAIGIWNTRAEEPAEKTAHWDINCDGYYPFCSHCGEATQRMSPFCSNCGRKMITRGHE